MIKNAVQTFRKKLQGKYALYFLCFMVLNYIEFLRSTQAGNVWKPAANCTGFVIMVIVFSQLPIKQFLKPANYIYTVVCIASIGLLYWHWTGHIGEYSFGQMATAIMNIWWLGLTARYFFRQIVEEKTLKLQIGKLGWVWILLTLWTVISVAGRWWPIWHLFMFGAFYLIRFNEEDKAALLEAMADGTIFSFFLIQSYAYLFRPFDEIRYKGAFANCNMMGLYYLIIYCMILFKVHFLHTRNAKWGWKLFYFIGAGGLLSFQFLTICRTAWVCAVIVTICYGWLALHIMWGYSLSKLLLRGGMLVICMVLTFPLVFWSVRWLPTVHPHPIWHEGEWSGGKVHSWDPADSEKYTDMNEFLTLAVGRFYSTFQWMGLKNPLVLYVNAEENVELVPEPDYEWYGNSITVRKVFFQTYWEHSNWYGHPEEDGHYVYEKSGIYIWHGQNLWIQMVYYFGYPAGILLIPLIVLTLLKTWKKAQKCPKDVFAIVPIVVCLMYFLFGITEVVWNPGQLVLTLVFFVMHPQLTEVPEQLRG